MAAAATIGHDIQTGEPVLLGDAERLPGLYMNGRSGTGKTTFILNLE